MITHTANRWVVVQYTLRVHTFRASPKQYERRLIARLAWRFGTKPSALFCTTGAAETHGV